MKTVVVTGVSGFLGRYLVSELLGQTTDQIIGVYHQTKPDLIDHRLTYVQCNLYDVMTLDDIIARADYVIHAAAIVSFHPKMDQEMMRFNTESTANVVNLCLEHQIDKLIHISSISALGGIENEEMDESIEMRPNVSWSQYGLAKKASEQEVWRGIQEGLTATIINPSLVMGSGNWDKGSPRMIQTVAQGLKYYPTGSTGFVYAADVARLVRLTMTDESTHGKRYLCSTATLPYQSVINEVAKCLNKEIPKKPIKNLHINLVSFYTKLKSLVSKKNTQIITKASLITASKHYGYNGNKALSVAGFSYTDIDQAIGVICQEYMV